MKQCCLIARFIAGWLCAFRLESAKASRFRTSAQKPKLELGFSGFTKNLTASLTAEVNSSAVKFKVPERLRQNLTAEVVAAVNKQLGEQLKPLKQSIAKTWVQMQEGSRDKYANAVKNGFEPLFANAAASITLHVGIGIRRAADLISEQPEKKDAELLAETLKVVEDDLFQQHCHTSEKKGKKEQFCISSPVTGFYGRLHDAEELVGMSLKFEPGGLVFVQVDHNHKTKTGNMKATHPVLQAAKK